MYKLPIKIKLSPIPLLVIFSIFIFSVFIFLITFTKNQNNSNKITITTSFYPLWEFTNNISGTNINVINITPPGIEPHDSEPTTKDIEDIFNSKIFIYNGAGIDKWTDKILDKLNNRGIVVINMTENLGIGQNSDPHFWLNPLLASNAVDIIQNEIIKIDSKSSNIYTENSNKYKSQLTKLLSDFDKNLASCNKKMIITAHDAFEYLAKRYNLKVVSISGIEPNIDPSTKQIANIITTAKNNKIKYVFFESLLSPKISQSIANEVGGETLMFDPIEGISQNDIQNGSNYISIQYNNLDSLKKALECN